MTNTIDFLKDIVEKLERLSRIEEKLPELHEAVGEAQELKKRSKTLFEIQIRVEHVLQLGQESPGSVFSLCKPEGTTEEDVGDKKAWTLGYLAAMTNLKNKMDRGKS